MQNRLTSIIVGIAVLATGLSSCAASYQEVLNRVSQPTSPEQTPSSTVAQGSTSSQFANLEQSVHQQINRYRQSRNLPVLASDARINQQARLHSEAMANGRVPFSHDGFDQRVRAISSTIRYRGASENVAYNQGYPKPDQQAVEGWLQSTGHRTNIEGNYDLTGIGVAKNAKGEYYFTQIFIKRR